MALTIEMSCYRWVREEDLHRHYNQHYRALLAHIGSSTQGFSGAVEDSAGDPIPGAVLCAPTLGRFV